MKTIGPPVFVIFLQVLTVAVVADFSLNAAKARAQDRSLTEKAFARWLQGPLWQKARRHNISRATFRAATRTVKLNWTLPDLLAPGQKPKTHKPSRQSEFRAPAGYFRSSHLDYNIRKGRAELRKWRPVLERIERRFGVPREIIISIWGKETAFGRARLPYSAIEVLATQAFMGRRKAMFERELLAALVILQQGHISAARMKSAWAGALGHPQFMPTTFLKHAVDFDGDGHKNIWTSVPDALASIASFLHHNGWDKSRSWGHEIRLPDNVACTLEGPDQHIDTRTWIKKYGIRRVDGRPFEQSALDQISFLLLPAGRYGPAFLVSRNFYVLKSYNESDVYALFIGHVADRMKGGRRFAGRWKPLGHFSRQDVKNAQIKLQGQGANVGGADGLVGYRTRISIGEWQRRTSRKMTCFADGPTLQAISR